MSAQDWARSPAPALPWRSPRLPRGASTQRTALTLALALVAALVSFVAFAPAAQAVAPAVSTTRNVADFPRWYSDQQGVRLEPCLDPTDVRCVVLPNPGIYDDQQPLVFPTNYPDEWFYSVVESDRIATPGCGGTRPGRVSIRMALEGTFATGNPVPGQQMVFARNRIRANSGLCPGTTYTFQYPYGSVDLQADADGSVNQTIDIGCVPGALTGCDFGAALSGELFQNFLKWDPAVAPLATPGYLSADAGVLHPIVGATGAGSANLFRVSGGANPVLSTNLFTVSGKIAGPLHAAPEAVDLGNQLQPINIPSDPRTVTFTNVTGSPLAINGVAISPATSPWSLDPASPTTCTGNLAPDDSCTATILFAPQSVATFTATLDITHGAFRSPTQIALKGTGTDAVAPSVTSAPSDLDFQRVLIGTTSPSQGVVVHNNGPGKYVIDGVSIVDVAAGNAGDKDKYLPIKANNCPAAGLQPGLDCTISVDYKPSAQVSNTAQLKVDGHVGATAVDLTAGLSGRGGIATSSAGLDGFGPDGLGTDGFPTWYQDDRGVRLQQCFLNDPTRCVLLAEPGFDPAQPINFTANYPGEAFYYIADSEQMTTPGCGAASPAGRAGWRAATEQTFINGAVADGDQMVFDRIRMNVTSGLCIGRTYQFVHPYGTYTFVADDQGGLKRSPGTSDIGCAPSPTAPCNFNEASFGPGQDGYLQWDATAPAAPAGFLGDPSVLHTVTGAPYTAPGAAGPANSVQLIDTTNNSVVAQTNLFTVAGQLDAGAPGGAPAISATPASLVFASQLTGTAAAAKTVTVTNTGTAPLTVSGLTLAGANAGDFTATGCATAVAPGSTCTVTVGFTPVATGARAATLTIASDATTAAAPIALTGTGIAPAVTVAPATVAFGNQGVGTASAASTVTVSNPGTAPLNVTGVTVAGANAGDFTTTNGCAAAVAPDGSCTIGVVFTPAASGPRSGSLTFATNASPTDVAVPLAGTGTAAGITVSASSLAFGSRLVNTTSAAQTLTVTNSGNAPLVISGAAVAGAQAADFTSTTTCATVAPAGTCTIEVTFRPGATGARAATLSISSNGTPASFPVSLTGTGVAPSAAVAPAGLTFADQNVATTSAAKTVTLSNPGTADLTISGITITGTNAADYATTNTCATTVAAGDNCTVSVTFRPAAAGTRTGTLAIATDAGTQSVPMTGNGIAPQIALAPATVAFGAQQTAVTSAAQVVTVTNPGTAPLNVSGITVTGTNAADFVTANTCAAAVAPNGSCTVSVTFRPAAAGARTGTLNVASDAGTRSAALTGTGGAATITIAPAAGFTFPATPVTLTSASQTITVTAGGTAPLRITAVTLAGTNPNDYVVTNNCTAALAPAGTCTILVAFKPTATGARPATLSIVSTASATATTKALTGTATAAPTVPGAPTIGAPVTGNASATVRWTAPANGGSAITGYIVQAFDNATSVGIGAPQLAAAGTTSLVYTGLVNGTAVKFQVRAINAVGTSSPSAFSAAVTPRTTPSVPATPTVTRAAGSITVSWVAPANGGSAITGYSVQRLNTAGAVLLTSTVAATATSLNVTGLIAGTAYQFKVAATNAAGTSAFSPASAAITFATVPGAPTIAAPAQGVAGGALTAIANWTAPANTGGDPITGYRVTAQAFTLLGLTSGAPIVSAVQPATARSLEMTLPAPPTGGTYRFTVEAQNGLGFSVASARSATVVPR